MACSPIKNSAPQEKPTWPASTNPREMDTNITSLSDKIVWSWSCPASQCAGCFRPIFRAWLIRIIFRRCEGEWQIMTGSKNSLSCNEAQYLLAHVIFFVWRVTSAAADNHEQLGMGLKYHSDGLRYRCWSSHRRWWPPHYVSHVVTHLHLSLRYLLWVSATHFTGLRRKKKRFIITVDSKAPFENCWDRQLASLKKETSPWQGAS